MPGSSDEPTRRALLRGGASAAAGLAGASAGCLELLPPLGQRVQFGRVEIPDGGPLDYRRFAPVESALPDDVHRSSYPSLVATPADDGTDVVGEPVDIGSSFLAPQLDYFGLGIEHYDLVVEVGGAVVLEGPVEPDAVGEVLTGSGYEPGGAYEGYDRYARDDSPRTVAVTDGLIVFAQGEHGDAVVEAVVDATAGRTPRRHERDEHYDELSSSVGRRPFLMLGGNDPIRMERDVTFTVTGMDFDDDGVYWITHNRYEPDVAVPEDELRSEVQDRREAIYATGVDLRIEGRDAILYSHIPHERYRAEFDGTFPPQITWGVDETDGGVRFRHEAGEAVDADRLSVVALRSDEPVDEQFADEYDVVGRGAQLHVTSVPDAADSVVVQWDDPENASTAWLTEYRFQ